MNFMKTKYNYLLVGGIIFIIILFISSSTFVTLQPGEKGIIFRKFTSGLDKTNIYGAGFHVLAPWNKMIVYDCKEQQSEETMDVLDKNGLSLKVDVSVRYNPVHSKIGYLHEQFGDRYQTSLLIPETRSSVRKVMGRYSAEEIYSTKRKEVEEAIISETGDILNKNNIDMRALLIRSIVLPEQIKQAIENKLKQEQEALAYQFKLEKEKSEAERKRIEAEGISVANNIVNKSLTDNLIKLRGIEATLDLASSTNSKVVVIGGGKEGLPIILGNQ
jgi:regulator of protease activity HflC (stomatin/prohibitin superfamily)